MVMSHRIFDQIDRQMNAGRNKFRDERPGIGLPTNDVLDLVTSQMHYQWITDRIPFINRKTNFLANPKEISKFCVACGYTAYQGFRHTDLYISYDGTGSYITVTKEDGNVVVNFVGEHDLIDRIEKKFMDEFKITESYVSWVYDAQYLSTMKIPIENRRLPSSSFYPFLKGESLDDYYHRFISSDANILILYGVPGCGKTSFGRGMIVSTGENAMVTYHQKLLQNDELFGQWFQSDENLLIIEDADTMLAPRADGNPMMERFLNIGDGLVSMPKKKLIFSTNLPNVSSIDEALLRPGRCHDILHFDRLTKEQAQKVADECNVPLTLDQDSYTIAEIFSDTKTRKVIPKTKFGFM